MENAVREYLQDTFPEVNAIELTDEEVYNLIEDLDFKAVIRHHQQKQKEKEKEKEKEEKDEQQDRNDDDEDNNNNINKKKDKEEEQLQPE